MTTIYYVGAISFVLPFEPQATIINP